MRPRAVLKQEKDAARIPERNRIRLIVENGEAPRVSTGIVDACRQFQIVAGHFQPDSRARREKELDARQKLGRQNRELLLVERSGVIVETGSAGDESRARG